jgi:hypothetical protein
MAEFPVGISRVPYRHFGNFPVAFARNPSSMTSFSQ